MVKVDWYWRCLSEHCVVCVVYRQWWWELTFQQVLNWTLQHLCWGTEMWPTLVVRWLWGWRETLLHGFTTIWRPYTGASEGIYLMQWNVHVKLYTLHLGKFIWMMLADQIDVLLHASDVWNQFAADGVLCYCLLMHEHISILYLLMYFHSLCRLLHVSGCHE